jgi:DNA-cytosine methyltransferase
VDAKMKPKKLMVLSLFDGMSCGQLALQRAGIPVEYYFASEINKYASAVTTKNFPDTVQLGDVNNWIDWNLPQIDLLLGGSPCQGFSHAGHGLNFDDPRSALFFKFVCCLKWYKPTYFLFENVKMKKEWQDIISEQLGVQPIEIDSALVSAQSRKRLYWTNIPNITQPEDKGILLKDIIEDGVVDRDKSYCIDANYFKGGSLKMYLEKSRRQIVNLPLHQSEKRLMVHGSAIRNPVTKRGIEEQLNIRKDEKSNCVVPTYSSRLNLVQVGSLYKNNGDAGRVYSTEGKGRTLKGDAGGGGAKMGLILDNAIIRKLTPLECERLQTVPDGYTESVSNTQRYKMLGNGWTIDVITHILKNIKE